MKTIKQIADEIGVSKQAVFYRIKKPPLSNILQYLMTNVDGVLTVSHEGETLIKEAFLFETVKAFDDKQPSKHLTVVDGEIIKLLQENLTFFKEQLQEKDLQLLNKDAELVIERQHSRELAEKITQLADTSQQLQKGQMIQYQQLIEDVKKKSIITKFLEITHLKNKI